MNRTSVALDFEDAAPALGFTPIAVEEYRAARDRTISEFELRYVTALLDRTGGNISRAARLAGMDRATLYRLVERHDLQRGCGGSTAWRVECVMPDSATDNTNFGAF